MTKSPHGRHAAVFGRRLTWSEMAATEALHGQWVALGQCRYEHASTQPAEADVLDADVDLAVLCERMRKNERGYCAIVFCDRPAPKSAKLRVASRSLPS